MKYLSVAEVAQKWGLSERSVRNYCAQGRIEEAFLNGKVWNIPEMAVKPQHGNTRAEVAQTLLTILQTEKAAKISGGIYHKVQIELTYSSNRIEGSKLTHDQTRYIYETNTIGLADSVLNVDDIVEAANHFRCIDLIIDHANDKLSEKFIKQLHLMLKNGTSDSRRDWFAVGEYKRLPNEVGGKATVVPEEVAANIQALLKKYNSSANKTLEQLIDFHYQFESIHPFQDGNGRVGRLILFKECLKNGVVPFIIDDNVKMFYYRGLQNWQTERAYLTDTCLAAQDTFKKYMNYFRIEY